MASGIPTPTRNSKLDFSLPMPAPMYARPGRESHDSAPSTPSRSAFGFVSPVSTPQGSPSKSRFPPGAKDLPDVFEQSLRLDASSSPTKPSTPVPGSPIRQQLSTQSPNKAGRQQPPEDDFYAGSPRTGGQENTPPLRTAYKDSTNHMPSHRDSPAAQSRHDQYSIKPTHQGQQVMSSKSAGVQMKTGLTPEEMDKLQSIKVKRLTNVTQIYFLDYYFDLLNYVHQRDLRRAAFDAAYPPPPAGSAPNAEYDTAKTKYLGRERANLRKRRTRLRHGDFHILTQVGQGGYGSVFLAQKKDTKEVCALKVMSKRLLFKMDEIKHVLTERDILTTANSDWLVRLLYAFQDETSIYLAMEYVPGGDFRTLLNNTAVLHNRHARFYVAEMLNCVDAIHQLGYIHRDLKPENFLIDSTGHVKLTDFGLAAGILSPAKIESMRIKLEQVGQMHVPFGRPMNERSATERREGYRNLREREGLQYAKSIVGSPDYMAPEVLHGNEYDFTVDYWSLGCMLYEAIAGYPPFAGATVDETWQNLRDWKNCLRRPDWDGDENDANQINPSAGGRQYWISDRTWNLITWLVADKSKRPRSAAEIRKHEYFAEVDWPQLRSYAPPFVPELEGETDAGYFDDFGNPEDMAKYKEVHDKKAALESMAERDDQMGKGLFVGFTFRHRKPTIDAGVGQGSARAASPSKVAADGSFGTLM